eukprot:TRINITY_DN35_c1_g1_i1.p1 TRINITY_DN35_c1_g1~~TRINITY_DN35_c1_g1_i1.p1  ORF type:complete len:299 (+),score=83.12 TRINITY_DN35_c1_g1_i1:41-937(+)
MSSSEELTQGVKKILNTSVQVIAPTIHNILSVNTTASLSEVMNVLVENQVLSVPVANGDSYDAFIGTHQVVHFILNNYDSKHEDLLSTTVNDILAEDTREFYYVTHLDTLQHAVDILSGKAVGDHVAPHRIAVFEGERLVSLLTQSRIVKYLSESLYAFNIGNTAVGEIGLANVNVVTVNQSEPIRKAFQKITELSIQAVAVVDDDDVLVGKISSQDIKHPFETNTDLFDFMETTISDYLAEETTLHGFQSVHESETLDELVDLAVETGVHRVFIVDEERKLQGIISLTDIMKLFSDN